MKKIKILACLLAVAMLVVPLASCKSTPKVSATCIVSVIGADEDPILLERSVTVEKNEGETITILDMVIQALALNEIRYEVDEDNDGKVNGITSVTSPEGTEYATEYGAEVTKFWIFTVNGEEPKTRANVTPATEGAKIVCTFTVASTEELAEQAD